MIAIRTIIILFLLNTLLLAEFKTVKIGSIDGYYKNKITKHELRGILHEIKENFKSQLGFDVFDISDGGRPINLLYIQPSMAQKRLDRYITSFERKKKQLNDMEKLLKTSKKPLEAMSKKYDIEVSKVNKLVEKYNQYIQKMNQNKNLSYEEYKKVQEYEIKQRNIIKYQQNKIKNLSKRLKSMQRKYNRNIMKHNSLIRTLNNLSLNIESLSRSIKVVKGNTIFHKQIDKKTYTKNGQVYKIETKQKIDEKIEIYGFDNKIELKAVIAHEIAHLVGIPHINSKGALMNPILQENQKRRLELTQDDIVNFKKHF